MGPALYYKSLSDTPAHRAMLELWTAQDVRTRRLQHQLFSHAQDPVLPVREAITSYQSGAVSLTLLSAEESGAPTISEAALEQLIISKMISGTSTSEAVTSENIFHDSVATVNIAEEFPGAYAHKKNNKASVMGFVAHVKAKEDFVWPSTETGSALRDTFKKLTSDLRAEYATPSKLIAVVNIVAIYQAEKQK